MLTGIDVSHWQGFMLWKRAVANGASFGFFKAVDWNSKTKKPFTDSQAVNSWNGTRDEGLINGSYAWIQPKIDPTDQAKYYCDFWYKYPTHFAIGDFEDPAVESWSDMAWRGQVFFEFLRNNLPCPILFYSSKGYLDRFDQKKIGWASQYYYWHAQYPVPSSWPWARISNLWKKWTFWQYTSHGPAVEFGATEAKNIDVNRFDGTIEDLRVLADATLPPVPESEEPEEPPIVELGSTFEVIGAKQNVRNKPSVGSGSEVITMLPRGTKMQPVLDIEVISANEIWLRFPLGWMALVYGGNLYMKDLTRSL